MTDNLRPEQRRRTMARVKSTDTKPEIVVRRLAHSLGFRFRLHRRDLPGKPDLTFPKLKKVIFVHGCFWHGHDGCPASDRPASNTDYWNRKLDRNKQRDAANLEALAKAGWRVQVVWECQTRDREALQDRLTEFLGGE